MNSTNEIEKILKSARETYVFSGYQFHSLHLGKTLSFSGGSTSYWPGAVPVTDATFFDLGSLTKVIATTSILARLIDQKRVSLDSTLGDLQCRFRTTRFEHLTLKTLASHSAGTVSWYPFYLELEGSSFLNWALSNQSRIMTGSSKQEYSDLSILLLWEGLEAVTGSLQSAFQKEVIKPLQLDELKFGPVKENVAATELCFWRKRLLEGEVFDENTAALRGVAAHAGLFGTARSVVQWANAWLEALHGKSTWITPETATLFTTAVDLSKGTRAIGFDTKSKTGSSAGELFSLKSFGHLGYTGTSVWVDPEKNTVSVLLTNRVHPSRYDERIRLVRPAIHDAVANYWS